MSHLDFIFSLAKRHKNFNVSLWKEAEKQDRDLVYNMVTSQARKLYRLNREVCSEIHLKKGFIRLNISKKGILFSKVNLVHNTEDLILSHFHSRFPAFHILLESKNKSFHIDTEGVMHVYNKTLNETLFSLEQKLPENSITKDLLLDDKIWQHYYKSQCISERRNIPLLKKHMPEKYHEDNVELRIAKGDACLTKYLRKNESS